MFTFNPILTVRNLYRHGSTSLISILGFTFGLVAALFLFFYIQQELSYDSFHADKDQIYRAVREADLNGDPYRIGVTSGPYAEALVNDFPSSILAATRAMPGDGLVTFGDKRFYEEKLLLTDANFFEFFSFPLLVGEKTSVLASENSVVLSKEMANKYFGEEDPIGQTLEVDNTYSFIVTGVMDDFPAQSHIEFDMVFPIELYNRFDWFHNWWSNGLLTYVKVSTPAQAEHIKAQLPNFMEKYFANDLAMGRYIKLTLEPFTEVYFNNDSKFDPARHGSMEAIYTLGLVAIAILFIACFNYVNLSIAQSFMRAKEVGVRKVMGVSKKRLILQFLGESFMILTFSILLAIGLSELLNPIFNSFFSLEIDLLWLEQNTLVFFLVLTVVLLATSGIYPAMLLSSFDPATVLKGKKLASGKNVMLRKGLVITQFSISIFLIGATMLISRQTDYVNSKDLGFDRESIILVDINNEDIRVNRVAFKEKILTDPSVSAVTFLSGEPGGFHDGSIIDVEGLEGEYRTRTIFTDTEYLNVFDIEIAYGRNFDSDIASDTEQSMIVNEQMAIELGLSPEELLGRKVYLPAFDIGGNDARVIGITKNFHFTSLKDNIDPLVIVPTGRPRRIAIKIKGQDVSHSLQVIDETYQEFSPDYPISYDFIDQSLARLYENEMRQANIFRVFSGISILLACLGIFGLAAYSAQQRQKELGIRKVLGATVQQIIGLISKEFLLLVLIASVVATPVIWYFMKGWLGNFAYRIELINYWYVFLLSGLAAMIVALVTVTFKTYRAAVSDPIESIRNE